MISFDDLDWFEFAVPAVTGVRNDDTVIGTLGRRGLLDLLAGRSVVSQRVATSLVDRAAPLPPSLTEYPLSAFQTVGEG